MKIDGPPKSIGLTHLVHHRVGVSDDVKLVKRNAGVGQMIGDSRDEGGGHVDAGLGNVLSRASGILQVKRSFLDGFGNSPLGHTQNPFGLRISFCFSQSLERIIDFCAEHSVILIEDCSHSKNSFKAKVYMLSISVYRHPDEFPLDVRQLFESGQNESVEFGVTWYRNFVNSVYPDHDGVHIYVLRKGGQPLAALPVVVENAILGQRVEALRNYYTSIYAPLIKTGLRAHDLAFLIKTVNGAHRPVSSFLLSPMNPESTGYHTLIEALHMSNFSTFSFFCFGNWYMPVDTDWTAYLGTRSGKTQSIIKRKSKQFAAKGGTLELILDRDNLSRGLDAYERVYASSWKKPEPYPKFISGLAYACAEQGWLRLGIAWLDGEPIATQLWIVANGKANIYKLAYDEKHKFLSAGTLLTAMLMKHAIVEDRVAEVDYLIGDDPYKETWMSHRRERWGIVAYNSRSLGGVIGMSIESIGRKVKSAFSRRSRSG